MPHQYRISHFTYPVLVNLSMNAAKIVDSLIEFNADLEKAGTKDGSTPLGWCAFKDSYEVSRLCQCQVPLVFQRIKHGSHANVGDASRPACVEALFSVCLSHCSLCLCGIDVNAPIYCTCIRQLQASSLTLDTRASQPFHVLPCACYKHACICAYRLLSSS